jgi:hypothetical protein
MNKDTMTNAPCGKHAAELSALVDGELAAERLLPVLDHLAQCVECRSFYRQTRTLHGLVSNLDPTSAEGEPPAAIWGRIEVASKPYLQSGVLPTASLPAASSQSWRGWGARLAALLLLGFGLWAFGLSPGAARDSLAKGEVEILLEGDEGRMTEARFLEIASEILRADRRYHEEMLQVMSAVAESSGREGSDEGRERQPEGRRVTLGEDDFSRQGVGWKRFSL